jgi:hypothetical protein
VAGPTVSGRLPEGPPPGHEKLRPKTRTPAATGSGPRPPDPELLGGNLNSGFTSPSSTASASDSEQSLQPGPGPGGLAKARSPADWPWKLS